VTLQPCHTEGIFKSGSVVTCSETDASSPAGWQLPLNPVLSRPCHAAQGKVMLAVRKMPPLWNLLADWPAKLICFIAAIILWYIIDLNVSPEHDARSVLLESPPPVSDNIQMGE